MPTDDNDIESYSRRTALNMTYSTDLTGTLDITDGSGEVNIVDEDGGEITIDGTNIVSFDPAITLTNQVITTDNDEVEITFDYATLTDGTTYEVQLAAGSITDM